VTRLDSGIAPVDLFHRGGANTTGRGWRAVNQAYSIPFIRQQIDLPSALGPRFTSDPDVRKPSRIRCAYATECFCLLRGSARQTEPAAYRVSGATHTTGAA